jgi:hypothetical protein
VTADALDLHLFDANPGPDLDRHQNGNSDPDLHQTMPIHNPD